MEKMLQDHKLEYKSIEMKATYRRLMINITDLQGTQSDYIEVVKGPPVQIGLDSKGGFLPPLIGFSKRVGLSHPSIVPYGSFITKDKKNFLFSIQNERESGKFFQIVF